MGLGKALIFMGASFLVLLTPGFYIIFPDQVSFIVKLLYNSYIIFMILALVIFAKGIDKLSSRIKSMREKRRRERIKTWEIQTIENYYT
ncbi:hypothetical protein DRP07_06330 [Archaeoglobales archaeon]|nr:MAG: hypothetical protein DRP07_06330 [Archaeoglobales archaeon]